MRARLSLDFRGSPHFTSNRTTVEGHSSGVAGRAAGQQRRARRSVLNPLVLGVLMLLAAAVYATFALYRFYQFNSGTYDLGIFDQAIDSYAHFQPGISLIKGLHNGFGSHFSILGDHFSPILALLAPLYWIYNGPQDLLIAQAVLLTLAIPPLWVFTRRALGGGTRGTAAAYLASVAYALSWPVAAAVSFDFHEVAFAPGLTALAFERLQAGRPRAALLALGGLLLVKEDMGLLVAGAGLVLLVSRRRLSRQRLVGAALIIAGLAAAVTALYVLIPAMGGRSDYYFAYGAFGRNMPQALWHIATDPARTLRMLVTPRTKLDTLIWLFGAFGFLPLLSPITLAAVPLLLERMLSSSAANWWGVLFHYNAFLVVVVVLGAVDGGVRLGRWVAAAGARPASPIRSSPPAPAGALAGNVALGAAGLLCAMAIMFVPKSAFDAAFRPGFFDVTTPQISAERAAVEAVPSGVTVAAANKLGPHLVARDSVILWDGNGSTPPLLAPWVVATTSEVQFTFSTIAQEQTGRDSVAFLEQHGYRVVFDRLGYYVLHRGDLPARHGKS